MRHTLMLFSALAFAAAVCGGAQAQKLDANGRCHGANGQFAKAEVCGGAARTASAAAPARVAAMSKAKRADVAPAAVAPPARAADPIKCRNDKGHFAKCGTPGAHPA